MRAPSVRGGPPRWLLLVVGVAAACGESGPAHAHHDADVGPRPDAGATPLPCRIDRVLAFHCRGCHGATPQLGAPMSLVTWEDMHRGAPDDPSIPTFEVVADVLTVVPPAMPPPPNLP